MEPRWRSNVEEVEEEEKEQKEERPEGKPWEKQILRGKADKILGVKSVKINKSESEEQKSRSD